MAEANRAYEEGDEERLRVILQEWESSPEAVKGEGAGADLVRVIRKIAQAEERLRAIEIEVSQLKESDLYKLKTKVEEAEKEKRDLLAEMAKQLDKQIADARERLDEIKKRIKA
jgi:chromosome segregation ATPase